jgi:cytochrome c oxidase cbb3-type subunit IV
MNFGFLHGLLTLLLMVLFLGIVWWAFSSRQKKRFEEAANLPFADEDDQPAPKRSQKGDKQ